MCVRFETFLQLSENSIQPMENNGNVPQREAFTNARKPPTRLQKRAPDSLQLDEVAGSIPTNPFAAGSETPKAIPFLSPLVLSPQPLSETGEKRLWDGTNNEQNNGTKRSSTSPSGGWQHPAVAAGTDPSTLLTSFQAQCMLVDHVQ